LAWLARTYTERQKYSDAEDILVKLLKQRSTFRDVRRMAAQFYAYNFLKQKEYSKAVKPLERAIKLTKNKKEKARFYFILGQIQEKLARDAEALVAYDKVLAFKNLPYDMEFSARMNVALFAYTKGQGSSEGAIKSLMKMAKEGKNSDYLDQIYFALAQISLKSNDNKGAIENLQKSLQYSKKNASQKAESYLLMADLLYKSENYLAAKNYYDSTITVLPKLDERYDEAKRLAFGLTDIAKNLKIIQIQDSLLRIAAMSPEQQKAFCLRLKQRDIENLEKAEAAAEAAANVKANNNDFAISYGPGVTPSTFFAYNFKGLQQGKRDFDQKWGKERKLEDNWRRKTKKVGAAENTLADNTTVDDQKTKRDKSKITDDEFRKMMANVPQVPQQVEALNNDVSNAMLALGIGYREALKRNDKCIKTLEELLQRFPESKNELDALYYLYGAYSDTGNSAKAKECYDKIIKKYPNTTYARILSDPDFAKKSKREGQELEDYYKMTYETFNKGKFKEAYERSSKADSLFKKNPFKPKFALISAMSVGNIFGKEKYIAAIKEVIAKFPETAEQKRAKEILRFLDGGESAYKDASGVDNPENGPYKLDDEAAHYIVVILTDKNSKVEDAKSKVSDFNRDNYKSKNLKISNVFFGADSEIPMLVIRKFEDKAAAMKYYTHVDSVRDAFMTEATPFEVFAISQNNYKELLRDKSFTVYKAFFDFAYKGGN
jgi:tetratricopeptide (TPR) repeat protein